MKVLECLNNIPSTELVRIRIVRFAMGGNASETTLDMLTSRELIDIQSKDAPAYYCVGGTWYIISNE